MKPLRTQPYFKYAIDRLPTSSKLEQAIAEYLGMRLDRDPQMHPKVWEACIDELVSGMRIDVRTKEVRPRKRIIGSTTTDGKHLVDDLIYLFNVATNRGWNHVYFTSQQDANWNNLSFYQDPHWSKITRDPETRKRLEMILNGTGSGHD